MDIKSLSKTCIIMSYLIDMNYVCKNEADAVRIIEENNIDISGFVLPYSAHNFQEYKQEVMCRDARIREIMKKRPEDFDIDLGMRMY